MRSLVLLFIFALTSVATAQRGHPVRPGSIAAQQTEAQAEKTLPSPMTPAARVRLERVKHDADELSETAQSISVDVDHVSQGLMPKDLDQKLKRVEKLAKQLRRELNQ